MSKTDKPMDDFGAPAEKPEIDTAKTIAEQALELDALRAQVARLSAKPAEGFVQPGDPNETYAGEDDEGTPLYFYRIDLAPCGGVDIRLSGETFFHGEVYKVTVHQLRTLREIVNRTWGHEQQIAGSNENFYRKETSRTLSGGMRRR